MKSPRLCRPLRTILGFTTCAAVVALPTAVIAAAVPASQPATRPAAKKPAGPKPLPRHQQIDHGPFVTATIPTQWPEGGIVNKAVAVRLTATAADGSPAVGSDGKPVVGGVLFDTDACRVAAGWVGGFVEFTKDWTSVRDSRSVKLVGTQTLGTRPGPGWAKPGGTGGDAWEDPRPQGLGPLPKEWVRYKGLHRHRAGYVVLSYSVGGCDVMELPTIRVAANGTPYLVRGIEVGPSEVPIELAVCDRPGATASVAANGVATLAPDGGDAGGTLRVVPTGPLPEASNWVVTNAGGSGGLRLRIGPQKVGRLFGIALLAGRPDVTNAEVSAIVDHRDRLLKVPGALVGDAARPLTAMVREGAPALWPQVVTTAGVLGQPKPDAAYAVDTITLPDDNPWHSWMRPGGFDFFTSDPTKAAICNWSGDVWTVTGLGGDLKELKWKRFASGLFQPLGLRIVNDQVYVLGRDQVTRLVDINGDGEADFYENFNNDVQVTPSFHEFAFDLQTDPAGNFYFAKAGPVKNGGQGFDAVARDHGSILKLSPDGKTLSTYATGFRAPNGIGVGPDGQVTAGDNEGTYVPKCRIAWVKPGGFYGVVPTSHRDPPPADYDRPLCWMPKTVDNSSGGQVWVTSDKWGDALKGRLLHLSYGTCSLFLVSKEEVNGQVQGGVIRLPLSFDSGIMRARFSPADGQLYVAGLKGWQTSAGRDGCFQRVRYTGKPVKMPMDVKATKSGLELTFTCPLDPADANDPESYAVERWNYVWKDAYGSNDWSVADPAKQGRDPVKVKSATLQADRRTVALEIPDMRPAMQYRTEVNLRSADGADVRYEVYHTVHELR